MRIIMGRSLLRVGTRWAQGAVADPFAPHAPLLITVWAVAASVWLGQSMWFWDRPSPLQGVALMDRWP